MTKRPPTASSVSMASALCVLAMAPGCTGDIGDRGGRPGGGGGGTIDDPKTGSLCTPANPPATTRFFRLTHTQYDNAVRALTGLDVHPSADFPTDQNQAGFDRGIDLQVGDALGKAYRASAETIAAQVAATPAALAKVLGCDPAGGDACARAFIADFGRRAYRRPLTDVEQAKLLALFAQGDALVDGTATAFQKGAQVALEAFLQSPSFLYRAELATQQVNGLIALGGYEIASRLSFMIQNGPPDDALLAAAAGTQLATADGIAGEARRLVATPAARATVRDFHRQWLIMDDAFTNRLAKDPVKYPTVTPDLAPVLAEETQAFVEAVTFDLGKGFGSLLTAPFTFVNRITAPLYGVSGTFGDSLQRVDLDPAQRAGIFTQIGFLAGNAYSNQSSPIHRGAFIQRQVLCATIPDPPPMVPELPPLQATQTTRQQVDAHTAADGCSTCHHQLINPVGFAFENYDAVGQYRTTENGVTVDASGTLAGTSEAAAGQASFTDAVSASRLIATSIEGRRCYATKWVRYAFGRADTAGDGCAVESLAANMIDDRYKITDLMVDMTRTKAFMFRTPGGN